MASSGPLKDELYRGLFAVDEAFAYRFGEYPDIFVVSLQEQTLGLLSLIENQWESKLKEFFRALRQATDRRLFYIKLKTNSIFFTYQYVFVRQEHLRVYADLETLYFSNYGGVSGKGTIGFKFQMDKTSFVMLSAHLDAHDYGNEERIAHYRRVLANDTFYDFTRTLTASYAFYAGDLNFRLADLDTIQLINDLNAKGKNVEFLEQLLAGHDQLRAAQRDRRAFEHFAEESITFRPTFKFHPDSREYNPKRAPSWCDRVLYRAKEAKSIQCLYYSSVGAYLQSDHRPVIAVFDLETAIRTDRPAPNVRVLATNRATLDGKLDVWLNKKTAEPEPESFNISQMRMIRTKRDYTDSSSSGSRSEEEAASAGRKGWDWIGLFREDFDDLDDYLAYLYVEEVPSWEGPPEEILRKQSLVEEAQEAKEGEQLDEAAASSSRSEGVRPKRDRFEDLRKKLDWSKLEFAEQTFTQPGRYVLIYFNGDRSVEYISEPIEIVAD